MGVFDISGKIALVTGGSKGLGLQAAQDLAQGGANLALVSRHIDECRESAAKVASQFGVKAMALSADIRQPADCKRIVEETVKQYGGLDILVNSAGVNIRKPLLDYNEEEWDTVLDTNLKGLFFTSQAAARQMKEKGKGKIVNISSAAAKIGLPFLGPYCSSKGGITQLTKVCALEWAEFGITVNAIAPTYIRTPLTEEWLKDPERVASLTKRCAIKRLGEPQDLTGLILLLASGASDYITGKTFVVDGGSLAGWAAE